MVGSFPWKKLLLRIALRLVLYGTLLVLTLSLPPFLLYLAPRRNVTAVSPASYRMAYEEVALRTRDGLNLAAWFLPNKNSDKAIIVCHGYPMDKSDIFSVVYFLARHYNLLFFDFRAMGKSAGRISTLGWKEREDVLTAVRFLKEKGFTDIGAFGFSVGAATIFLTDSPDIRCIVSDSSYASLDYMMARAFRRSGPLQLIVNGMSKLYMRILLGIDSRAVAPVRYISGMRIPVLLIHCTHDTTIPVSEAQRLHAANPRSRLWLVPVGDHGESSLSPAYENTVIDFFKAHL